MKALNVIGPGRVGRTLARLWSLESVFAVQDVLGRSGEVARSAVAFMGQGASVVQWHALRPAEVWMITTPDGEIAACAEQLAASALLRDGDIVFHCSGSLSSAELASAAPGGARIASVHPLKTFANPLDAVRTFAGTCCAAEGDAAALRVLTPAFEKIGARVSEIAPGTKALYHAASVIVCNHLTALIEAGLRTYEQAGIHRKTAVGMIEPLMRETLLNALELGPEGALTGPIARGDERVVESHLRALDACDPQVAAAYRSLSSIALDLARARGDAEAEALSRIEALLRRAPDSPDDPQ